MASAVDLRPDCSATELRRLAATTKNANQSRRLLSLTAVVDGMNRTEAARIGGGGRETRGGWGQKPGGLGESVKPTRSERFSGRLVQGTRAAPLGGAAGRTGGTRRDGSGQGRTRGRARAPGRPAAGDPRALRGRLS